MKPIREILAEMKAEAREKMEEYDKLASLLETKYPDLERTINRWDRVRYRSALANDKVTNCDISHNCGCCEDSPLEVWPYLEDGDIRIYSNPIPFTVGERNAYGCGEKPYDGWDTTMREANISESVIEIVRKYLENNPPEELDDEDW